MTRTMSQHRARIALAKRIASEGGCCVDLAIELGISKAAVSAWFKRYPELSDILADLKSNIRPNAAFKGSEARRIALMRQVEQGLITQKQAAERLGVTSAALSIWRRKNWIALEDERTAA